jgi:phospholipase C
MKRFLANRTWIASALLPVWIPAMLAPAALEAQSAPPATTTPIKHVVVLFQENVSFDHYFGTYPNAFNQTAGEPQFKGSLTTPAVNGLTGALLTSNPNSAQPVRLSRAQAITCDQDHAYTAEQQAVDSGLMDQFVQYTGVGSGSCDIGIGKAVVMGYYDGNTVTALWNYAQNFAMSDNSFGTTFGPSAPGAMHLISGQTAGATLLSGSATAIIANGASSGTLIGDARPPLALDDCTIVADAQVQMTGKNAGDLLNAKNVTWGWFQGGFTPSSHGAGGAAVCATAHNNISGASAGADYIPHHAGFQFYASTANPHHLPPSSIAAVGTTDQANHQYDLSSFFSALAAGNLPAVSYLKAAAYQDGHAGYSDPIDEQTWLVGTINTIMQSPFWSSTAIIIAYDDSDGWYDHVMGPIVSPSSVADDALAGPGNCGNGANNSAQGRCGYGPRLPLMVISPYAKINYVDHSVTDQSSVLRFIEDNWSLGRIGNGSMDAVAGTINDMFNFNGPPAPAVYLDPSTGLTTTPPSNPGGGGGTPTGTTTAVANPQNATVTVRQFQLDGTASTSYDGKALAYQWTLAPGSLPAAISGANTATPTVQFGLESGPYTFTLTVTDDEGHTASASTTVNFIN